MTSCKTPAGLYSAAFRGVTCTGDMALWKKPEYSERATALLLSLYGSENQLKGIFSALATNNEITLESEEKSVELTRGWEGHLRFNSWKIGYGKYHAVVWNEELVSECIVVPDPARETEAWERFLSKKRIPLLKDWVPRLARILEREGLVEALEGAALTGWHWTASDDEVCDLLVREIHK